MTNASSSGSSRGDGPTQATSEPSPPSPPVETWRAQVLDKILGTLSDEIVDDATGRSLQPGERLPQRPQFNLWLGMLASKHELASKPQFLADKRVPAAHGFTFRVKSLPIDVDITVGAALYLPLLPTVEEQRRAAQDPGEDPALTGHAQASGPAPGGSNNASIPLTHYTTKTVIAPVPLHTTVHEGLVPGRGIARLSLALKRAVEAAHRAHALGLFRPPTRRAVPRPADPDLRDDATWQSYLRASLVAPGDFVLPCYEAEVEIEARQHDDYAEVTITVINTTQPCQDQFADKAGKVPWPADRLDTHLYEVELTATTSSPVLPYQLEQVEKSYRYNRDVPLFGENTAAELERSGNELEQAVMSTRFGADARTARTFPRQTAPDGTSLDATFRTLIADPVRALTPIVDAADDWVRRNWSTTNLTRLHKDKEWNTDAREQAELDAEAARAEVAWVRNGLKALESDPELVEAFRQAMRAMQVIGARKRYQSLHLFQVAWIVGCLPGVKDPAADPTVDIVWFATGGGKSEAYLGLMLVTLFYARRTGTTAGTLVWARFPLRLLSLQQTERFGEVIAVAEQIRRADPLTAVGEPFAVGYFVGSGNTPNRFYSANSPYAVEDPEDPDVAERCRVLDYCPTCSGYGAVGARSVQVAADAAATGRTPTFEELRPRSVAGRQRRLRVAFDVTSWTMHHVCDAPGCPASGNLPVYVVDDDIYRRTPAVLVGTVDKLAQIALQAQFGTLLGRAASRCPVHGLTTSPQWCAVFGCGVPPGNRLPAKTGLGGLRLEIADEMHLLDEELGALDGMYETLLGKINEAAKNPPLRIVGATATLEGYRQQVQHLYQRDGRRFPANGPTVDENFWSYTREDRPLRRYLGLRPRRIAYTTASIEVALTHKRWLDRLRKDPTQCLRLAGLPTDPQTLEVAREAATDLYEVFLAYALRNEDLGRFMREERLRDFHADRNWAQVNSDADPASIRRAVRRLVNPSAYPDNEQIKTVVATKAIGHGFDVARLGVMVMMGTPTQASEVIQASARVGRVHPGLVVSVANPTRDRDVSTHRYYKYWIAYLDRLIHKVPINRESLPVLKRVLPGGLMAWLLQIYDRGWLTSGPRRRTLRDSDMLRDALTSGYLTPETLTRALQEGFGLDPRSTYHDLHRSTVQQWVDNILRLVQVQGSDKRKTPDLLDPRVPNSLRDVEEPIDIFVEY